MQYRSESNRSIAQRLIAEHNRRREALQRANDKVVQDAERRAQRMAEEERADRIRAHAFGVLWK